MGRYVCIHGHFYQPPRENPWLEAIETQDTAYPYHDWNERICVEAYGPNATSRILDERGHIARIVNNYGRSSFNFGPTLLWWLENGAPEVYRAILRADDKSRERFGGHGSAMAQVYNHVIMPLAASRDRVTQVRWGLADFEKRFDRVAEGMWLAECAVDTESLEVLAAHGVKFTVLAPGQARRVRPTGGEWRDASEGRVDTGVAYEARLPSGRSIALFFYDGPLAQAVAFERLLASGDRFAERLAALAGQGEPPRLAHVATDGETYGHHHRHGDMALAYALHVIEQRQDVRLTNYGEFLALHPPAHEVEIFENSSWSCAHGVERWRSDCGCATRGPAQWRQGWRGPLRQAFDWLRGTLAEIYEQRGGELMRDPWEARNDYIDVIFDRSDAALERFFEKHARRQLEAVERSTCLKLLEMQRHALLMYTSCAWFFSDISDIETVQNLRYAARAIQLAEQLTGRFIEPELLERLSQAESNLPELKNGREIYRRLVKPAVVDLEHVVAHYAVSSLFESYEDSTVVHGYRIDRVDYRVTKAGRAKLATGRVRVASEVTREAAELAFGVLHLGDHNLSCGVRHFQGPGEYDAMVREVRGAFSRADVPEVLRLLDRHFVAMRYSLKSLFADEQRKVLASILGATVEASEAALEQLYESYAPLIRFLGDLGVPPPPALSTAAEVVLNSRLRAVLSSDPADLDRVHQLLEEARATGVKLDAAGLGYALARTLERMAGALAQRPDSLEELEMLERAVTLLASLPFDVEIGRVQNVFYEILADSFAGQRQKASAGDAGARQWIERASALATALRMNTPA